MWKPIQDFTFNADANEVFEFVLGPKEERPRPIGLAEPYYRFVCWLIPGLTTEGLYTISMQAEVSFRHPVTWVMDDRNGEPPAILRVEEDPEAFMEAEFGRIIIRQVKPEQSEAILLTAYRPRLWKYHEEELLAGWAPSPNVNLNVTVNRYR